ncbi:MAG: biopolymer transporter ExbD [Flavobacteriales bacterium]|nr:biopolymer transporter ExbD [Flavobacteriales bacterium]
MSKFSKGKKRKEPAISTASLPDIVFMLLFFFMVTAKFKTTEALVEVKQPSAFTTEVLDKNDKSILYWIGKPKNPAMGDTYRVQLDDQMIDNVNQIGPYLIDLRSKDDFAEGWYDLINYFQVDKEAPMGLVRDVQEQLRDPVVDALKVQYAVKQN